MKKFDNEFRDRYYGLRVGDIVNLYSIKCKAEVIGYGFLDNNSIRLKLEDGREVNWIAEHCEIITKVEDR
jgi:hypothetical protein